MKENISELIKKFESGKSSLAEEKFLIDHPEKIVPPQKLWLSFIQRNKPTAPEKLKTTVWEAVKNKRSSRHRRRIGIISAAASVLIIVSVFILSPKKNELSSREKETLLNEALNMFKDNSNTIDLSQNVLYEDEMIIIYTSQD